MKRWMLSTDGGTTFVQEVHPVGNATYGWERDLNAGQIFFRRKLTSDLVFGGKDSQEVADFALFKAYEADPEQRCTLLYIREEQKCAAEWVVEWTGRFSTGSGSWFFGKVCQFTVRPEVVDRYTCVIDVLNKKVNVLEVPTTTVQARIWPNNIEVIAVSSGYFPLTDGSSAADNGYALVDSQAMTIPDLGFGCPGGAIGFQIYWREYQETPCVDGNYVSPNGEQPPGVTPDSAGWFRLPGSLHPECVPQGRSAWARFPTLTWPFPNDPLTVGQETTTGSISFPEDQLLPPTGDCSQWVRVGSYRCIEEGVGIFLCIDDMDISAEYTQGRKLVDVIKYLIEKSECEEMGVVSDFFEWDPIGDAPGYVAGENYVTGETNQVDQLFLYQKGDVVDPDATEHSVRGETTLKQLLGWMRTMFRVYWDVTDAGDLRFEHIKFWAAVEGLDLTIGTEQAALAGRDAYASLKDEIPSEERLTFEEASGVDFVGVPITYSGPCVTTSGELSTQEYVLNGLTTDVGFIASDPDKIDEHGFVLLAAKILDDVYYSIISEGALTGHLATNMPLSTANLQDAFWRWDRYRPTGNMNEADETFDGYLPNIEQTTVLVRWCCDMVTWDPRNTVKTPLGENHLGGRQGFVQKADLNSGKQMLTLTLRYGY